MKKLFLAVVCMIVYSSTFSQLKNENRFEIKTNLMNLIAIGPSVAIEYNLQKNSTMMISLASGKIDYGDFGGITKYKTSTFEFRKYSSDEIFFGGAYLKNISKQVFWQESTLAGIIPIGQDRNFIGNGLSAGAAMGFKLPVSKKIKIEMSSQIGYGHYYKMSDKNNNLPSGNYLDARIALWLGFQL